ncbi:MAG: alpha/beta hydrolase, partial [Pseudomonadota bacterium]
MSVTFPTHSVHYILGAGLNAARWRELPVGAVGVTAPGQGLRPRIDRPDMSRYADVLLEEMPGSFVLAGHSFGGMVAAAMAAKAPERCRALILIDTPLRTPTALIRWYAPWVAPIVTRFPGMRAIARTVGSRVENDALRPAFKELLLETAPGGLADTLIAVARFDAQALLPRLTMPLLALRGARSLLTGGRYEAILRGACSHVEIETMDTGHMIPFDDSAGLQRKRRGLTRNAPAYTDFECAKHRSTRWLL